MQGDKENGKSDVPVTCQAYHIIDVFMHHLPKIILDESGKLTIYFTAKPDGEQQYMKNDYFHVSWYYAEKPCLNKRDLKNMSQEDINEYYLGVIVDTLRHIARINNRALELNDIIDGTARKVRGNQYELIATGQTQTGSLTEPGALMSAKRRRLCRATHQQTQ